MPDSVCDVKLLKKTFQENREIIRKADRKIEKCAEEIRKGRYPKNGLHLYNRIAGLLCQRLWYYSKTKSYSDQLKISNACTGCGLCTRLCPADNLTLKNGKAAAGKHCTMCYRSGSPESFFFSSFTSQTESGIRIWKPPTIFAPYFCAGSSDGAERRGTFIITA